MTASTPTRFSNATMLDHIAWVVPDTAAGCEQISELTGIRPYLMTEPEPGAWYWSGGLNLGDGQLLEIIGPNPAFTGFHPLHALISSIPEPRLLFWYVHVDDIEMFAPIAAQSGRPLTTVESIQPDDANYSAYQRCSLSGPIDPIVPNIISWTRRRPEFSGPSTGANLTHFRTMHPEPDQMNALFAALGIDQHVEHANEPNIEIDLATPNGSVTLRGAGNPAAGFTLPPATH